MRNPFRCFNSSPEVIRLAVMLYIRYPLSSPQVARPAVATVTPARTARLAPRFSRQHPPKLVWFVSH
jgi:hypothetical protein